ncbi:MAG TPA: hypothetical protein VH496_14440 [Mycobacterium sp.]|nr:hypothetical protein [Micromonosporaceae bacterium]
MRTKNLAAAMLLTGAALVAGGCSAAAAAAQPHTDSRSITGTWTVTVKPDGAQPAFQSTITYTTAGGLVEATSKAPSSAGVGIWTREGSGHFAISFIKYRFDGTGAYIGTTVVTENDVVDPHGDSYSGRATTKVIDASGTVLMSFTSTSHAERVH